MMDLQGKVAVVTGGAGGIGRALGRRFGREGMKVVLADVLAEPLEQATRELADEGVEVLAVLTDVTDYASIEALATEALARFGAVHVVCNNAAPVRSPRATCGSTTWPTGGGESTSTCSASSTASRRSCRSCSSRATAT